MDDELAPLRGRQRADAVIVGGGLTGLMCADELSGAGLRVILLEAGMPGQGATRLCGGAVTLLCAPVYRQIAWCHGLPAARTHMAALRSMMEALPDFLRGLAPFREAESYVYAYLPRDLPELHRHLRLCQRLGLPAEIAPDAGGCPFPLELSMHLPGQLLIDVQALVRGLSARILSRGGRIHSRSPVLALEDSLVHTPTGCAVAPVVILACGKPPGLDHSGIHALLESRTMVQCMLHGDAPLHTLQQSVRPEGLSLTPTPGGIWATFCAGRSGTSKEQERIGLFRRILTHRLADYEPGELQFRQELWPLDGLPVIGALPDSGLLLATGYCGHGVLGAMLAAQVITRQILGRTRPADRLYAPDRHLPAILLQQAQRRLRWYRAASRLHPGRPVCTLCRCRLRYCPDAEHWGCPVCGSVYGMLGANLGGPAIQPARISALQRPDL